MRWLELQEECATFFTEYHFILERMSYNLWLFRLRYLADIFSKKKKKMMENKVRRLTIPNFETYYKATVIETVWYC